jgi:hypothetical protein
MNRHIFSQKTYQKVITDNFLFADKKLLQEWREYQVNKKKTTMAAANNRFNCAIGECNNSVLLFSDNERKLVIEIGGSGFRGNFGYSELNGFTPNYRDGTNPNYVQGSYESGCNNSTISGAWGHGGGSVGAGNFFYVIKI